MDAMSSGGPVPKNFNAEEADNDENVGFSQLPAMRYFTGGC